MDRSLNGSTNDDYLACSVARLDHNVYLQDGASSIEEA